MDHNYTECRESTDPKIKLFSAHSHVLCFVGLKTKHFLLHLDFRGVPNKCPLVFLIKVKSNS